MKDNTILILSLIVIPMGIADIYLIDFVWGFENIGSYGMAFVYFLVFGLISIIIRIPFIIRRIRKQKRCLSG